MYLNAITLFVRYYIVILLLFFFFTILTLSSYFRPFLVIQTKPKTESSNLQVAAMSGTFNLLQLLQAPSTKLFLKSSHLPKGSSFLHSLDFNLSFSFFFFFFHLLTHLFALISSEKLQDINLFHAQNWKHRTHLPIQRKKRENNKCSFRKYFKNC